MQIGIIRGSFNPPNYGHIFAALYAAKTYSLDSLFICPIYKNPTDHVLESWDNRVSMIRMAYQGIPMCKIDTTDETNKSGACLDFIKNTKQTLQKASLVLFSGIEKELDKEIDHNEEELLKLCSIIPLFKDTNDKYDLKNYSDKRIKKLIGKEKWDSLAKMLPVSIIKFIQSHNMYMKEEELVVSTPTKKK